MTNEEFLKHVGMELKIERIRQGFTQDQLAKTSKLEKGGIGKIERGEVDAHILSYKRLSDALGKSLKDML